LLQCTVSCTIHFRAPRCYQAPVLVEILADLRKDLSMARGIELMD
jgi:hypothetical protein